jgi:hypothetical protein
MLWLVGGVIVALVLVAVKGVLQDYRRQVWFTGIELSLPQRAAVMTGLITTQVRNEGVISTVRTGWTAAVTRSATLDLLADIVRRTPRDIPYWGGQTYVSLIGFAIPRILWPGKPEKTLGQDFGHRYSFIEPSDRSTSINIPFLIEFYANFGVVGVFVGMFLTGCVYRVLDRLLNVPGQSIVRSLASLSIMLPLLNIESDFSLVFGGLFMNAVAFEIVLRFLNARIRQGTQVTRPGPAVQLTGPSFTKA